MKKNKKAAAAVAGIAVLLSLYLATFLTAFLDIPYWDRLFQACLTASVGVPILIWIVILLYRKWKETHENDRR